jgi:hypothetical protein
VLKINLESRAPSNGLDEINMKTGVIQKGERDEKQIRNQKGNHVQLG